MHYCGLGSNMKKMKIDSSFQVTDKYLWRVNICHKIYDKYMSSWKYNHIYVFPGCLKFAT